MCDDYFKNLSISKDYPYFVKEKHVYTQQSQVSKKMYCYLYWNSGKVLARTPKKKKT